jgi:RNA polymerase sigma factor (sigma-70 family)
MGASDLSLSCASRAAFFRFDGSTASATIPPVNLESPLRAMSRSGQSQEGPSGKEDWFTSTHWSVVLAAGQGDSTAAQRALEKLCHTYWYPLYAYVRRQGHSPEDAQDLTQGFFANVLERNALGQVDRQKGKFRAFLIAALKHHLSDQRDRERAVKRGGTHTILSLDEASAEERYRLEPVDETSPDKLFDRRWALTTLEQAVGRLRKEYQDTGKGGLFEQLQGFLSGAFDAPTYGESASRLGMTENTLKSYVHRLRQRNREILREVIADTVACREQIEEELRDLVAALADV